MYLPAHAHSPQTVRKALISWYWDQAARILPERVRLWHPKVGVNYPPVRLGNQRTQWGNCNEKGVIRLNWRIMQSPMELIDYLVVHELTHLKFPNHSKHFWDAVERVMPDYHMRKQQLNLRFFGPGVVGVSPCLSLHMPRHDPFPVMTTKRHGPHCMETAPQSHERAPIPCFLGVTRSGGGR